MFTIPLFNTAHILSPIHKQMLSFPRNSSLVTLYKKGFSVNVCAILAFTYCGCLSMVLLCLVWAHGTLLGSVSHPLWVEASVWDCSISARTTLSYQHFQISLFPDVLKLTVVIHLSAAEDEFIIRSESLVSLEIMEYMYLSMCPKHSSITKIVRW